MKTVEIEKNKYELIKNFKDAFNEEVFKEYYTEYFEDYDYIVGDIAYGKLRLKGFYDEKNKNVKKINNYKDVDKYLDNNCAKECAHFILKKIK